MVLVIATLDNVVKHFRVLIEGGIHKADRSFANSQPLLYNAIQ